MTSSSMLSINIQKEKEIVKDDEPKKEEKKVDNAEK